jgi:hypothetical protein
MCGKYRLALNACANGPYWRIEACGFTMTLVPVRFGINSGAQPLCWECYPEVDGGHCCVWGFRLTITYGLFGPGLLQLESEICSVHYPYAPPDYIAEGCTGWIATHQNCSSELCTPEGTWWSTRTEMLAGLEIGATIYLDYLYAPSTYWVDGEKYDRLHLMGGGCNDPPTDPPGGEVWMQTGCFPTFQARAVPVFPGPPAYTNTGLAEKCCERQRCTSHFVQQTERNDELGTYDGPCCIEVRYSGVKARQTEWIPPTAYYGYQADLPDLAMNPTIQLKNERCSIPSQIAFNYDLWRTDVAASLNPMPTLLYIWGELVRVVIDHFEMFGLRISASLIGAEQIAVEDQANYHNRAIGFSKTLPDIYYFSAPSTSSGCWCYKAITGEGEDDYEFRFPGYSVWYGQVFTLDNLGGMTLDYDPALSVGFDDPDYRGPDYTGATASIWLNRTDFYNCRNDTDCTELSHAWGWTLDWMTGFGRPESIVMRKSDGAALRWSHPLRKWMLFVDPTLRDAACQMRLLLSCEKLGFNYGFTFPSGYDPCPDGNPVDPVTIRFTKDIPHDPVQRVDYLECGFLPGSDMVLTPVCGMPSPMPESSKCDPTGWTISSAYGITTISGYSGVDEETGVEYTVVRIADGEFGEGNYTLQVQLHDVDDTSYTVSFTTGNLVDCCQSYPIDIVLGGYAATIQPYCPTPCDTDCWLVSFTPPGESTVYYICVKDGTWWRYSSEHIVVDVVRMLGDTPGTFNYFLIRNIFDAYDETYTSDVAIFTGGSNCDDDVELEAVCQFQQPGGTFLAGTATMTTNVRSSHAPVGTAKTITIIQGESYEFTEEDFGFTDPDDTPPNNFVAVHITTLPTHGTLYLSGVAVAVSQRITVAQIANLTYLADGAGEPYATFTFQVEDDGGLCRGGDTIDETPRLITFNVFAINHAPVGTSQTIEVPPYAELDEGLFPITVAMFGFTDPNDDPPNNFKSVRIESLPTSGSFFGIVEEGDEFTVAQINGEFLIFVPDPIAGPINSSFTFRVRDDGGTANGGVDLDTAARTLTLHRT